MKLKPARQQVVALMRASSGTAVCGERCAGRGLSARNKEGLDSLVEEIRGAGGEATAVAAEISAREPC